MADYPISNVPRKVQYVNSGVGPYAFAFEVLTQTDIAVYRGSTLLTLTTDYTVTINANGTGSITLVTAGTGNITIVGARAIQRSSDYTTGGDLFASTLNTDLDSQTIFSQQLAEDVDLSIKIPVYAPSTTGLTVNPEANGILAWDSTGANLINLDPAALVNVAVYATAYADVFVSNGVAVAYTLSRNPGSLYNLDISVDGVTQEPVRDYTLLGTVVTFTSAIPINSRIVIKYKEGLPNLSGDSQDIRYVPAGTGAVTTTVQTKLRETVSVKDFGAIGNGVADDSTAIQNAINYVDSLNGGNVYFPVGEYLAGGLIIDSEYVNLTGASEASIIRVKNSTTGIWIKQHWCNITNLTIQSQGTKNDGLGTNGVLYEKAAANSIGFVNNQNLTIKNFSGYGLRVTEAINFYINRAYVVSCTTGITINRSGTGPADFSTTIDFENVYVTSCGTGIFGEYVYRSRFNVIAESCTYGMDMNIGDFTLFRCYFEDNITLGARVVNAGCQDLWSYNNNPTTDAVSITFTGAVAAANRGFLVGDGDDMTMKRLALLSGFGVDPLYLAAYGTTSNDGLKYGENTVALVRGTNLFNNADWAGNNGSTNDFDGWDNINQGFKIAGTVGAGGTNDPYGMVQTVTLDNTKEYVIDLHTTTVSGSGITSIRVGSDTVTNGVAFTPTANGANVIKCFGADITGTVYEAYVNSFTIAEVLADQTQIAESNDRLTRQKIGRGVNYVSAAPTTGAWLQGEIVYNTAPTSGGYVGWVCTASGKPGTWNTFGLIS